MMCMYVYVCIVYATHAVRNFILALSFDVKVLRLICNFTMSVTSNYAYSYRHARMHINFAFFNERMLYCFAWYSQLLWNITYSHRYASSNLKKKNDTMDCSFLNDFPELNDAIELRLSALYFQVFTMNRKFRFIVVFFYNLLNKTLLLNGIFQKLRHWLQQRNVGRTSTRIFIEIYAEFHSHFMIFRNIQTVWNTIHLEVRLGIFK